MTLFLTDAPVEDFIWLPNEPNNHLGNQDHIRIWYDEAQMKWGFDDYQNFGRFGYICEYELGKIYASTVTLHFYDP